MSFITTSVVTTFSNSSNCLSDWHLAADSLQYISFRLKFLSEDTAMTLYWYKPIQTHWANLQKSNIYNCLERCINSKWLWKIPLFALSICRSEWKKLGVQNQKEKNATLVHSEIVNRLCPTCSEGETCLPISRSTAAAINRHVFWAIRTALSEGQNWDNWHQK